MPVKTVWKWLVSVIAAVGVAVWAAIKWFGAVATTGVVIKTVATTGAIVAATAFSFNFGDKGGGLKQYANEALGLMAKGENTQAVEYMDRLVASLDDQLMRLEEEAKAQAADPATKTADKKMTGDNISFNKPTKARILAQGRRSGQVAELVRASVRLAADNLSDEGRLAICEEILNANADESSRIIESLMYVLGNQFDVEDMEKLMKRDIPSAARGKLALWLADRAAPGGNATTDQRISFYEALLSYDVDAKAAKNLLSRYLMVLNRSNVRGRTHEVLDHILTLFSDSEVGTAAAVLLLGAMEPGPIRDERVVTLVEKYPDSAISRALKGVYLTALISQSQFEKVLKMVDNASLLDKITTQEEAAEVCLALLQKACLLRDTAAGDGLPWSFAKKVEAAQEATPLFIQASLAEQFAESGDYALSTAFNFEALRSIGKLPADLALATGQPIREPLDLGDITKPNLAKPIAKYFTVLVKHELKETDAADGVLQELAKEPLPKTVLPYVLFLMVQNEVEDKDYDSAVKHANEALAALPDSPILLKLQTDVVKAQQQTAIGQE